MGGAKKPEMAFSLPLCELGFRMKMTVTQGGALVWNMCYLHELGLGFSRGRIPCVYTLFGDGVLPEVASTFLLPSSCVLEAAGIVRKWLTVSC